MRRDSAVAPQSLSLPAAVFFNIGRTNGIEWMRAARSVVRCNVRTFRRENGPDYARPQRQPCGGRATDFAGRRPCRQAGPVITVGRQRVTSGGDESDRSARWQFRSCDVAGRLKSTPAKPLTWISMKPFGAILAIVPKSRNSLRLHISNDIVELNRDEIAGRQYLCRNKSCSVTVLFTARPQASNTE